MKLPAANCHIVELFVCVCVFLTVLSPWNLFPLGQLLNWGSVQASINVWAACTSSTLCVCNVPDWRYFHVSLIGFLYPWIMMVWILDTTEMTGGVCIPVVALWACDWHGCLKHLNVMLLSLLDAAAMKLSSSFFKDAAVPNEPSDFFKKKAEKEMVGGACCNFASFPHLISWRWDLFMVFMDWPRCI